MHRTKKITIASGVALLMAAGMSSALAAPPQGKTTICHATGRPGQYREITVSNSSLPAHRRHHHGTDIIPAPAGGCSSVTPNPGPDPEHNPSCIASSTSSNSTGNQTGLINVGNVDVDLANAAANLLCQASVANNPAITLIGDAFGGVTGLGSAEGCFADSISTNSTGDQTGAVNVGNVDVDAANAAASALCQASVLDGLAVSLIGPASGGSSLGSGLLSGGPLGLLSGGPGWLLSGLTTDVTVLANVLVTL